MPYIIRFFRDPHKRAPRLPNPHWCVDPVYVFRAEIRVELIPNMAYIIRFFGDPPKGAAGPPMEA